MKWFHDTGVWGWVIVFVAAILFAASIACAVIRVPRVAALMLIVACGLPALLGVAGMFHGRFETDQVVRSLMRPDPGMREEGYAEAQHSLWLGLGAMLACDVAATAALLRSKPPER